MSSGHGAHGHVEGGSKRMAVLIAALAAVLAITEAAGKSAQTEALNANVEAANLWAFFQAKTIRRTSMQTAAEHLAAALPPEAGPDARARAEKQVDAWRQAAARYESEPETGEGRRELMERAKIAESRRDRALAAYHMFEYGSAAFQLAIVLASAAVVTAAAWLTVVTGVLGVMGLAFGALGAFAPTLLHL